MRRETSPHVQTTTQVNAPPRWASDILRRAASDALTLYDQGKGGNVYQGGRYAGLGETTKKAIKGLETAAGQYHNALLDQWLRAPTQSDRHLSPIAKGHWIGHNGRFNDALNNALTRTSEAINQSMSGAGRYGSGAHSKMLAEALGTLATEATAQQYNHDVNAMMKANQMIDQSRGDQIRAANAYYQGQSQAQDNALRGGRVLDLEHQNALESDREKWREQDNQGWNRLEKLLQLGTAAAGGYGTKTGHSVITPAREKDPLKDVQTLLGLFRGIIGLSDARAKENIVRVGERKGYPLYDFTYKGNPQQRYRGVMAQDVLRLNPGAVYVNAKTKALHVDYSQIGFGLESL